MTCDTAYDPYGIEPPADATLRLCGAASAYIEKAEAALERSALREADAWKHRASDAWTEAAFALRDLPSDEDPAVVRMAEDARAPLQGRLAALGRRLRAAEEAARPAPAPRRRIAYGGEWRTLTLPLAHAEDWADRCFGGLPDGGERADGECCETEGCACLIRLADRRRRYGKSAPGRLPGPKARTVRLDLTPDALRNLRSDASCLAAQADDPDLRRDSPDLHRLARSAASTLAALTRAEARR